MGYKIIISNEVQEHINEILWFITQELKNTDLAIKIMNELDKTIVNLEYLAN
jgi:hypothetical protein